MSSSIMRTYLSQLEEKLKTMNLKKRRHEIHRMYCQAIPGRKSGKRQPGPYRDYFDTATENLIPSLQFLEQQLLELHMETRAKRTHEYYAGITRLYD